MSLSKFRIEWFKKYCAIGKYHYCELLYKLFIINVPLIFRGIYKIICNFLEQQTIDKINILGYKYKKELLNYIDEGDLLDFLGGTSNWYNKNNEIIEVGIWHNKGQWDLLNDKNDNNITSSINGSLKMNSKNTKLYFDN